MGLMAWFRRNGKGGEDSVSGKLAADGTEEVRAVAVVIFVKESTTGNYVPLTVTNGKLQVSTA